MPKLLNIQVDKTFSRIGDKRITTSFQGELYTLYKTNPEMVKKILDCVDVGWRHIQDKILLEGVTLLYDLDNYNASSYESFKSGARTQVNVYYTYKDSTLLFTAKV